MSQNIEDSFIVNNQKFPDWAPKEVISEWEEEREEVAYWQGRFPEAEPDTAQFDLLYRLLTYPDMKTVWEKLPKYEIKPTVFSSMVRLSWLYIETKPHNLTTKEYKRWIEEVREASLKLADLIELSSYDQYLQEKYFDKRRKRVLKSMVSHSLKLFDHKIDSEQYAKTQPEYENCPDFNPGLLSTNLRRLADLESDADVNLLLTEESPVKLEKPNHPNARRSYFIKKMTQLIRRETRQPLREIVTKTTATVFDDPTLTERQIIRTAP
ncbi:hypothetical protein EHLJMEHL_02882 [Vreelandella titanicae]